VKKLENFERENMDCFWEHVATRLCHINNNEQYSEIIGCMLHLTSGHEKWAGKCPKTRQMSARRPKVKMGGKTLKSSAILLIYPQTCGKIPTMKISFFIFKVPEMNFCVKQVQKIWRKILLI